MKKPGRTSSTPATRISAPWAIGPTGSPPVSMLARSRSSARSPCQRTIAAPRIAVRTMIASVGKQPDRAADLDEERDLEDRQPDEDQNEPQGHAAPPFGGPVRWTRCPRDLT